MADMNAEYVRSVIHFDGQKYYWKKRPNSSFANQKAAVTWNAKHAGKEALTGTDGRKHCAVRLLGKTYKAHRIVWLFHYGEWPKGEIDHINGDGRDNRLCNLRDVSHAENCKNMPLASNNKSGFRGVHWDKQHSKWRAFIKDNGLSKYIGLFDDIALAVAARKQAEFDLGFHPNHGRLTCQTH